METISLTAEKLKKQIIGLLNSEKLPPIIIYYIIKDIYSDIEKSYIDYINTQLRQQDKEEKQGQN